MPGRHPHPVRALVLAASLALPASVASAKDLPSPPPLPGVSGGYSIVKPAPVPDDAPSTLPGAQFKIGDTEVRISGTVTIGMATGAIRPPRH